MPTQDEIDELLSEARRDPDKIIAFQTTRGGLQLFTNSNPFGKPGDDLAWAFAMEDQVKRGVLTIVVPGTKWKLSSS